MTRLSKVFGMAMLLHLLLLLSGTSVAQTWTAVATDCLVDEDDVIYYEVDGAILSFQATFAQHSNITVRCNVTNPLDSGNPAWSALRVGYLDPDGTGSKSRVNAVLKQVDPDTGDTTTLATFNSDDFSDSGPTYNEATFGHSFDFERYAYYIYLQLTHDHLAAEPKVWYAELR